METFTKIISVCKSELITYEQIKELKKILNIKKKLIAGALANNGYKFKLEESDISFKPIVDEERVISYIDTKIKEIIDKINNADKNNLIEYSKQLTAILKLLKQSKLLMLLRLS